MVQEEYKKYLDEGIYAIQDGNYQNAIDLISKSI